MIHWCADGVTTCAGEINFVLFGVLLQMLSIATESSRLVLVQVCPSLMCSRMACVRVCLNVLWVCGETSFEGFIHPAVLPTRGPQLLIPQPVRPLSLSR
jgi:hypothetical protein